MTAPVTTTAPPAVPVDLTGPLPTGTTVLEASAGTGKTYTIAGLVTRYVAEGTARMDELLVVTFGRAATGELRTRVRERLVAALAALEDPADLALQGDDVVLQALARGTAEEVRERRDRVAAALASFDAATVATVHQFCQQVLAGLGTAADVDPTATLVESLSDVLEEVCDDLYVRFAGFAARQGATGLPFDRATALRIAKEAVGHPEARLEPARRVPGSDADLRVRFAAKVRAEVEARKQARRVLSFDDLLGLLRDALAAEVTGPAACERLRRSYSVVLVDEFQDTDEVQWDVLRRAFHGFVPLVLIGDPKQAIYRFRGADVRSYLDAAALAGTRATLSTNHRSDPLVLAGVQALLRGAALGQEGIVVRPVAPAHRTPALVPADETPVRLRVLPRAGLATDRQGVPLVSAVRPAVAEDVAAQVTSVLAEGLEVRPRTGGARPLAAGDVAVLVRTSSQAVLVQEALQRRGVPCVLSRGPSVFTTPAAREWVVLLEALEQPHRVQRVRRLALSSFVGTTAAALDAAGDGATDDLSAELRQWARVLSERGVAGLFAVAGEQHALARRLLGRSGGERLLTDLRHVAETLHAEAVAAGLGLASLLSWLRTRVEDAGADVDQERSRRLDTDRAAVQIATVHTSKGLEFEVVCLPYGWDEAGGGSKDRLPLAHDPEGHRVLHVGGPGAPGYAECCAGEDADGSGEELRLLYVAVTRAVSRVLLWWAPSTKTARGPLHRLLFAPDPLRVPEAVPVPSEAAVRARLEEFATPGSGIVVQTAEPVDVVAVPVAPVGDGPLLEPARFRATVDGTWRRTSYSGLTRAVHETAHAGVGSETDAPVLDDEADLEDTAALVDDAPPGSPDPEEGWRAVVAPMADLPAGAEFGTLVHGVLEHFDSACAAPLEEFARLAREGFAPASVDVDLLARGLLAAAGTPLGPLADGRRLLDVASADRLVEMDFELPLSGGDDAGREGSPAHARLDDVADLLRRHLPAGDPVAVYAAALSEPVLGAETLSGYLTGSIDAVVRVGDRDAPRYLVVDYKTNRLAGPGEPLTAWHYRPSALDDAVRAAHYPLQALLYCVALHRFLRWRQLGYDPEVHLGGVLYLFLRGMCGDELTVPAGQAPPGVWSWKPPAALVTDLSDLLARGPR
ncbi:UvrD-helicase domain-containing protein [Kineococcus rubinsiae]|uniref:UvrD-helicase domain-containing protein n=1 Tax=Kineococcus rubinsiae TaxID=2609562 RepID=UPI001430B867|nr:UvrD-helicase domain-containing protein [Kineococcus rubinsiae]